MVVVCWSQACVQLAGNISYLCHHKACLSFYKQLTTQNVVLDEALCDCICRWIRPFHSLRKVAVNCSVEFLRLCSAMTALFVEHLETLEQEQSDENRNVNL